jgi:endonuclease/exonuclease/phosphatase family metal-dependent hydrolase
MTLKILSWNIWYDGDFAKISKFFSEFNADIVGLGEVVPDDPTRDTIAFMKSLGYQHIVAPVLTIQKDGRTMSNGLFSKYPIVKSKIHSLPDTETDKRNAIQAVIDVKGQNLNVFMTHLLHTHQKPDQIQEAQIESLLKILTKEKTIVMGDFNATPDSVAIKKMRENFVDAELKPVATLDPDLFDCPNCDAETIPNTRLDYIFTSPDIKTNAFKVHKSMGSDHLPISVEVVF